MSNKPKNPAPLWRKILAIVLLVVLCIELYFIIKPNKVDTLNNEDKVISTETTNLKTEKDNESKSTTQAPVIKETTTIESTKQETTIMQNITQPNKSNYSIEKVDDVSIGTIIRKDLRVLISDADNLNENQLQDICKEIVTNYIDKNDVNALTIYLFDDKNDINGTYTLGKCGYYPEGDIGNASNITAGDYKTFTYTFDINARDSSKKPTDLEIEIYNYLNDLLNDGDGSFEYEDECEKKTAETFNITQDEVSKIWLKVYGYKHN